MRVAIIGSGPAGFYAAAQLLAARGNDVQVDMFDRLATPWGLVRAGVAPDHPKIKSVTRVYEKVAAHPLFRFCGNVEVGLEVSHNDLSAAYHAVLYAVGAATDRRLNIPGEDLPGSHPATSLIGWYNGHPDYTDELVDLSARRVAVVGNGNVAIDVARMLLVGADALSRTDTADHALEAFARSEVEEVVLLGRRGPAQAAFTTPELRELGELDDVDVVVAPSEVELDPASQSSLDLAEPTVRRNVDLLQEYARRGATGHKKRILLRFCVSPVKIIGRDRVEGVQVVRNELAVDGGRVIATPTGESDLIEAQLVFRSIGYRATPVPGLPFDNRRGTLPNDGGRVINPDTGRLIPGVYAAGWIKRGPSGVIGTNKKCANETVALLLEDDAKGLLPTPTVDRGTLLDALARRGVGVVNHDAWRRIDEFERAQGQAAGRPRVKLVRCTDLLERAAVASPRATTTA